MASVWRQILGKVKASAMTNLLMCDYVCGFLAALGRRLFNVFILYVNFFKNHVIIFWFCQMFKIRVLPFISLSAGGLCKHQLYNLVIMFRFLWISDGPTYSALPVNAKEVSGDVHFRRKLLFHCCPMISGFQLFMYLQLLFWFQIVLAEYPYSLLCLFGF